MRRNFSALLTSVALAGTFVAAQTPTPGQSSQPSSPASPASQAAERAEAAEATLTGCLVQGSGPNVFILENAKTSATDKTEGKSYVVMAAGSTVDLRGQLNRQVRVVGATGAMASPGQSSTPSAQPGQSPSSSATPSSQSPSSSPGQASSPSSAGQAAGSSASPSSQAGQSARSAAEADEKDMPRLSAKSITRVADTCATS